jgi:hypothetical protein
MKKRTLIILTLILVTLAAAGWYAYSEFTRKVKDLSTVKADIHLNADELIAAFENNEQEANQRYLDKVIAVRGMIRGVEKSEEGNYTVILGEKQTLSAVRCSMDAAHADDLHDLPEGTLVIVKGACTGFKADELLGSDVILNRAVIQRN